jgi:Na+-transporting NADH:ubiquinone oxidoreductase subunit A
MKQFKIKKGLDIRLAGSPRQEIANGKIISRVAVVGRDYVGLKPRMLVAEGDRVVLGQPLFTDRSNEGVQFVAPGTGRIREINRGERRILQSVVIELDDPAADADAVTFPSYDEARIASLAPQTLREQLIESGTWLALRTRPYSKVPQVNDQPEAIFVTATDTNPLAPDPAKIIGRRPREFKVGLQVLARLTPGPVYLCQAPGAAYDLPDVDNLELAEFSGPHPAGLVGTHIHFLHPVNAERAVWTVAYQDVIAIGHLFLTGEIMTERVISLAGPLVSDPRLLVTRWGAYTEDIVRGEVPPVRSRVIAGSVLGGRRAADWAAYLGRRNNQVTVLAEPEEREFIGWLKPGWDKFSAWPIYLSWLFRGRKEFALTTTQNGSERAMVPVGQYERVMPQDYLPTQLLRALLVKDTVRAQQLGCLELHEEDLALCSFVCPSKYDYGPVLRANLELIEKEG